MFDFSKKVDAKKISESIYSKYKLKRNASLLLGLFLIAISFNFFLLPNNIVFGGVSGLSIITKKYFEINPSFFMFITSILLLVLSFIVLGKEKTRGSVLGSLLFPVFTKLTENVDIYLNFETTDLFLCALFGGVLYGIGAGLVFKAGFTTGGTDIINQIVSKYCKISMGSAMLISDGLIVLCGGFVFGLVKLMYALIVLYVISLFTDKVMLGISDSKAFYIIAENYEEIKGYIIKELGHGVTILDGKGGFTKEKQRILFCVIPTKDYFKLKEGIHEIEPKAFFVAMDAYEVLGGE